MKIIKQISNILMLCTVFIISDSNLYANILTIDDTSLQNAKYNDFNSNLKTGLRNNEKDSSTSNLKTAINSGNFTLFRTGMPKGRAVLLAETVTGQNIESIKNNYILHIDASSTNEGTFSSNVINITSGTATGALSLIKATIQNDTNVFKNVIATDNRLTLSGVKVTGRLVGIENISTSRNNTIIFDNINADDAVVGIYMNNARKEGRETFSGPISIMGDSITMKNISTVKSVLGYEFTRGVGPMTNIKMLFENIKTGTSAAGEGNLIGISSPGGNASEISNNQIVMLNTEAGGTYKTYGDIKGIATYFSNVEVTNNRIYFGFNPETKQSGYLSPIKRRGGDGKDIYGGVIGLELGGVSMNIHDNLVVVGGKQTGSLSHGVIAETDIVGFDIISPNDVTKNTTYIGYAPDEAEVLSVYGKRDTVGVRINDWTTSQGQNVNITANNMFIHGANKFDGLVAGVKTVFNEKYSRDGASMLASSNLLQIGASKEEKVGNSDTTIQSDVYGVYVNFISGKTFTLTAENNTVFLNSSKGNITLQKALYGAYGGVGTINNFTGNKVLIDAVANSISVGNKVYGVSSQTDGTYKGNAVQLKGTVTTGGEIYGAYSAGNGTFDGNGVEVVGASNINSAAAKDIYGAYASNYGKVSNNYISLNANNGNITLKGNLYGAYIKDGTADESVISGNKVNLVGNVTLEGSSYGAYNNIAGGTLDKNGVILGDGVLDTTLTLQNTNNIYGAYADKTNTTLTNNFVGINNKTTLNNNQVNLYGAYAKAGGTLKDNKIIIGDVETHSASSEPAGKTTPVLNITSQGIYGAYADGAASTLENNSVILAVDTNVTSKIYGAYAGAGATGSTLSKNSVSVVNNAKVTGDIYGAYAENSDVSSNGVSLGALAVDKGTINLTGNVYGGYSKNGTATKNVVKLNGRNNFQNANIYGGYSANNQDQVTGNVLLLNKFRGSVGSLNNFEQIEFQKDDKEFTSANAWKEDDVIINIKGGTTTNLNGTKLNNVPNLIADAKDKVYKDARMYLMYNEKGGLGKLNLGSHQGRLRHGYLRYYDYHIKGDDLSVQIILGKDDGGPVEKPNPNPDQEQQPPDKPNTDNKEELVPNILPEAESFLGGRDALAIMVKRGGDMVAAINSNIIHPLEAESNEKKYSIGTFLTTGGGYVQDEGKTTEIQVSRGAVLTGIGANFNQPIADIFLTTFFEGGYGTYTRTGSYDVLGEQVNVTADGKSDYYGGGFTLRSDFKVKPAHIVYIDSSFRGGETNYSYKAKNYTDIKNVNAEYKSATAYYGAHVGTGYMYNLNDKYIFDVYAKYLFSYYDDDQVSLSDVEKIDFDSFSSHRINSGLRVSFTTPVGITPYIGAGVEYQADEDVSATAFGKAITGHESTLDVMGTFEAGFTYGKQFEKLRLNLDVKGKGSAGALNSGAGSVDIRLDF